MYLHNVSGVNLAITSGTVSGVVMIVMRLSGTKVKSFKADLTK